MEAWQSAHHRTAGARVWLEKVGRQDAVARLEHRTKRREASESGSSPIARLHDSGFQPGGCPGAARSPPQASARYVAAPGALQRPPPRLAQPLFLETRAFHEAIDRMTRYSDPWNGLSLQTNFRMVRVPIASGSPRYHHFEPYSKRDTGRRDRIGLTICTNCVCGEKKSSCADNYRPP